MEESTPFGRTGPELPGDCARDEGNLRARAARTDPGHVCQARKHPIGWATGGNRQPAFTEEGRRVRGQDHILVGEV